MNTLPETPQPPAEGDAPRGADANIIYLIVTVLLISMGLTLLVISLAYIRDIETLHTLPGAIWNFICGRPTPEGPALPLLLTLSTFALLGGAGMVLWDRLRRRT